MQLSNQPITWQQLKAMKLKVGLRMGRKGDLTDFERSIVVVVAR